MRPMKEIMTIETGTSASPQAGLPTAPGSAALLTEGTPLARSATATAQSPAFDIQAVKARQKATWESGDFGQIAKVIIPAAEEFMAQLDLRPGMRVLDAACGTGNLAVIAARRGCRVDGLDIATNLIAQARERARGDGLAIEFAEGDAEAMPYEDGTFDAVVSMYGVMFAPRPDRVVSELCRVTKPGGLIALANWTREGFIGKLFDVFSQHVPAPSGLPSPLWWGDETVVRHRFGSAVTELRLLRRMTRMIVPFDAAGTVNFFRRYYGPTNRAFGSLDATGQAKLQKDLVELQARANVSAQANQTDTPAEYLEIQARRAAIK
jgi:SAM-dependent methyltransferase